MASSRTRRGQRRMTSPRAGSLALWLPGDCLADQRTEFLERPLGTLLSGGQAARAGLAALQVARFDVVLLDEPTNHLDTDGLQRLAMLLGARPGGVVLVSHDRALLAETVSEIVELDRDSGQATQYRGGWDAFQREREAARERARTEREHARTRRDQLIAAERETRRRSAASVKHARGGVHDNDKQSREWVKMRAEGMAARARKIGSRASRIDVPDAPWERPALHLHLTPAERRSTWIVALDGVVLRRGEWSLGPLTRSPWRTATGYSSAVRTAAASRRSSARSLAKSTPQQAAADYHHKPSSRN